MKLCKSDLISRKFQDITIKNKGTSHTKLAILGSQNQSVYGTC